ncbi:hypothetical protein LFML04_0338 [Leptospirillum ferriphilum ML-04]|uniref:Uncharacterized protein n=1 Tax=Leptospirillum ferriphilum (strain ML-04) TaxID=1048260 RepID=J9Z7R2_LEPFM|nr:hypothetical protein LFML04_0338 [Leptospirillum ferriphilum ML-04]
MGSAFHWIPFGPKGIRHLPRLIAHPFLLRFGLKKLVSPKEVLSDRIHGIHIIYG